MIACDHPVGETLSNAAIKMLFLVFQILHKIFRHEKTFKVNTSYFTIDMSLNIVIFIFSQLLFLYEDYQIERFKKNKNRHLYEYDWMIWCLKLYIISKHLYPWASLCKQVCSPSLNHGLEQRESR